MNAAKLAALMSFSLVLAPYALAADRAPAAKSAPLAAGYRGVALSVPSSRVEFLKPGDRVDVLCTFEAGLADGTKQKVTATILQDVVVVGVRVGATPADPAAIEIQVNPNEAQYAALAQEQGEVHFARRPAGDTRMTPMEMASLRKLFK